jgi:hypothetical protein
VTSLRKSLAAEMRLPSGQADQAFHFLVVRVVGVGIPGVRRRADDFRARGCSAQLIRPARGS